jgi:hypothetical protein
MIGDIRRRNPTPGRSAMVNGRFERISKVKRKRMRTSFEERSV